VLVGVEESVDWIHLVYFVLLKKTAQFLIKLMQIFELALMMRMVMLFAGVDGLCQMISNFNDFPCDPGHPINFDIFKLPSIGSEVLIAALQNGLILL